MPEVIFTGSAGRIEGRYHPAKVRNAPIAIVLHPHPQFGGTMNHQIVYQIYYAFVHRNFAVLRETGLMATGRAMQREEFGVAYEARVVSAHRTPKLLCEYAETARARGLKAIIAGAGGAAHLPGMIAAMTPVPVLGVPVQSRALSGLDSLLSIVQMPRGIPVATFAIGEAGAANAALLAIALLANEDAELAARLDAFRARQTEKVLAMKLEAPR